MSNGHAVTVDDLPGPVLELVFARACATGGQGRYRHNPSIPLVCKRWADVYSKSSVLWADLRIDWTAVLAQSSLRGGARSLAGAARWVRARLPVCRRLTFSGWSSFEGFASCVLLEEFKAGGLGSQRLEEVRFVGSRGLTAGEGQLLLVCGACPRLHTLALSCPPEAEGHASELVMKAPELAQCLSGLPSLRSLDLRLDKLTLGTEELGPALSALTHLSLRCRLESAALAPGLLEGLSQLRRLELGGVRLAQFTPRLCQALSQLTHLCCSGEHVLAARPRRRAGITLWEGLRHLASLRELVLEHLGGGGMPANALACPGLTGLTLLDCAAEDWPLSAFHRYTGEGGCLGRLRALHLESLKLVHPIPPPVWRQLAPALTHLTWHDLRLPDPFEAAAAQAAALEAQAELEDAPALFQAVEVPAELSALHSLRCLRLEYAQLDAAPPGLQALTQLTFLSLEGNRLASLPQGRYLIGLRRLDLAVNAFEELPEALAACSSLTELRLSVQHPPLALTEAHAEQLERALPHLARLTVHRVEDADTGTLARQAAALDLLARMLGGGLVLEAEPRVFPLLPP